MLNDYGGATPPGTFTVLEIQTNGSYGDTAWRNARFAFYGLEYTPTVWFDSTDTYVDAITIDSAYAQYLSMYNTRRVVTTDVTIDLSGRRVSDQTYQIQAKVGIEEGGTAKTLRIYLVQVLDYWPEPPTHTPRYGFVQAATPHGQEDVVSVSPGTTQTVTRNFTFTGDSWANQDDIKIVAWAQASTAHIVYQAATLSWPFIIPGDMNGDRIVDVNDIGPFSLALVDRSAYESQYPDIDADATGDTNGDGVFNSADIQALLPLIIDDRTAPLPNPMTWSVPPTSTSTSAISMTGTTATDISGVEYYFTGNGIGVHSSGWISSPIYTDTGLQTNRSYSYKVKARDLSPHQNTTADSTVVSRATFIETPTGLTVGTITSTSIRVTAAGPFTRLDQNLSGLYFEVTDLAGAPAGSGAGVNTWTSLTTSTTATASGLTPNTTYRFRVKARNYYGQDVTPWYPATDYVMATTSP
ncbi:MAG TPA: fibronectin type III domain-containing protein [Phycisphaerae bacterium]|nr:fibronectin type III domain-containing protein [Phycisphaerae bacterium]